MAVIDSTAAPTEVAHKLVMQCLLPALLADVVTQLGRVPELLAGVIWFDTEAGEFRNVPAWRREMWRTRWADVHLDRELARAACALLCSTRRPRDLAAWIEARLRRFAAREVVR